MPLLRNGAIDASPWTHYQAGNPAEPYTMVELKEYLSDPISWHQLEGPWIPVIQPDDDANALPSELLSEPRLGIAFPTFTDGRGYSIARQLRQQHSFEGELVAIGDIRRDQIDFMSQVGIDSFECSGNIDIADWQKALVELHVEL